ncbi:hypothetical protein KUM42_13050 [Modestobacter sp. L9-4]|uniref:polysaccharide biosynthesis tyrosine autokinase n=1 Tax=Modestobacter sp. L9-4 TaxID=2851567 RepID=UPI001C774AE2|nr:polysaccharide biosynthesis tyrosine autokinase [Modestobacter sp. L9-4]QXG74794.1 hypothetical protein KUM42_13050 [Modestobacter sp. L9-4]
MELRDARRALRARWWSPVLGVVVGLAVAALVLARTAPTWSSTTSVFVDATEVGDLAEAHAAELFAMQRLASYVELADSERLVRGVVDDLGLDETPAEVASRIRVEPVADSVVLRMTVTDSTPERARQLAAAVAAEFTEQATALEQPPGVVESVVRVTTIQPATLASEPVGPDVARVLSLGGGLGLLLGALLVLVPTRVRRTVGSTEDVRTVTGAAPLATLLADPRPGDPPPSATPAPGSPDAAALRRLRAQLRLGHGDTPPRVVVVTGGTAGGTRSTLALRLALSLAEEGSRVVLVEADLHAPALAGTLGLPDGPGLGDVLAGTVELESALRPWGDGTLTVLPAGATPPGLAAASPAEGTAALLTRLRTRADVVLVDATPLSVADAVELGEVADGILLESRFEVTPREQLAEAARALADTPAGLLGAVLTGVPARAARVHRLLVPYAPDRAVTVTPTPAHVPSPPAAPAERPAGGADRVGPLPAVSPEPS